ncbi:delta(24(24(1)))-sterol reductase [Pseudoscourfieldia marina]
MAAARAHIHQRQRDVASSSANMVASWWSSLFRGNNKNKTSAAAAAAAGRSSSSSSPRHGWRRELLGFIAVLISHLLVLGLFASVAMWDHGEGDMIKTSVPSPSSMTIGKMKKRLLSPTIMSGIWLRRETTATATHHKQHHFSSYFSVLQHLLQQLQPTPRAALLYFGFVVLEAAFAIFMPGPIAYGFPLIDKRDGSHHCLAYRCNGLASWHATLALVAALHFGGVYRLETLALADFAPCLMLAMITGDLLSIVTYLSGKWVNRQQKQHGNDEDGDGRGHGHDTIASPSPSSSPRSSLEQQDMEENPYAVRRILHDDGRHPTVYESPDGKRVTRAMVQQEKKPSKRRGGDAGRGGGAKRRLYSDVVQIGQTASSARAQQQQAPAGLAGTGLATPRRQRRVTFSPTTTTTTFSKTPALSSFRRFARGLLPFVVSELSPVNFSWCDYFMGTHLNPRLFRGALDLKFWAEIRISWMMLFFLTLSCALAERTARVAACAQIGEMMSSSLVPWFSNGPLVLLIAHALYANACMKGEECIPTTFDIFHERFGFMLAFWNVCGVPFMYATNAYYLFKLRATHPDLPNWAAIGLLVVLFAAYYVWDTSQSQKNMYRMREQYEALRATSRYAVNRTEVKARLASMSYLLRPGGRPGAWPKLPGALLAENAEVLTEQPGDVRRDDFAELTKDSSTRARTLLVGGWWRYARKIHYTADTLMAWVWALCCVGKVHSGTSWLVRLIPFFYPMFFTAMIVHRERRDFARCSAKYGKLWKRYTEKVPYAFVPGVF